MRRGRLVLIGALVLIGGQAVVVSAFAFGLAGTQDGELPTWPYIVALAASGVVAACLLVLAVVAVKWWNE